eukprot:m.168726 g.168726  ORF g.168726 m.168726 type:complete len:196 (+) comp18219_c0_seq4:103-690(+)
MADSEKGSGANASDAIDPDAAEVVDMEDVGAPLPPPEPITAEVLQIHMRVAAAFRVFDHEGTNAVDVRELGSIIRSLGLCPLESELAEMILECEDEEDSGIIKYSKFEPMITRVLQAKRFRSESEEQIAHAFKVLDTDGKGYFTEAELTKILMEEGEGFTAEEMEEMLVQAKPIDSDVIHYDEHVPHLHVPAELT